MIGGYVETYFITPQQVIERAQLSVREEDVVKMFLGLTDGDPKTMKEIGKVHGVTKERISGLLNKAFERMQVAYQEIERETNG